MKQTFKSGQLATFVLQDTNGGVLRELQGFVTGTVNTLYFLHIFDAVAVPANGTQPKKSLQVLGQDGFAFSFAGDDLEFKVGICFGLSSTEDSYTAVTDGSKVDWEGEFDTVAIQGTAIVGDLTTTVNNLQVWSAANGPRYLYEVDWIPNDGVQSFLMYFASDGIPVNGSSPLAIVAVASAGQAGQTIEARFGRGGLSLLSPAGGIGSKACILVVSSTSPTLTIGTSNKIRARYRTIPA